MASACNICRDIRHYLEDLSARGKVDCGPFHDAPNTTCPTHQTLLKQFYEFCRAANEKSLESKDVGVLAHGGGSSPQMIQSVAGLGYFWGLLLVNRGDVPGHPGIGRTLDRDWVDLEIMKRWKDECLTNHGSKCENPMKIWPARPAWLIDVEQKCVVSGHNDASFVALSYRWGDGLEFRLSVSALEKLKTPYALDGPEILAQLAPVVQHAIYLTSRLGERYLWVDSVCITHGDPKSTNEQLNLMGGIYANAVVTIIAADHDAHVGIRGLNGISASRELDQTVIPFEDDNIIVRNTGIFSMSSGTPYYKRGWTYQEYTMSKRRIIFNNLEVHWECSCCVWHEELQFGAEIDKYINPRLMDINAGFPDMPSLNHCITRYNERALTFNEDSLPGITGLLTVLSRSFTGGFLYGLAEMQFESALCWKPYWDHTDLERRVPSNRPDNERVSSFSLPSWSWVGWRGLIGWDYHASRINIRANWFSETIPTTEWYTWDTKEHKKLRRIRSTWFENRDQYKNPATPLPEGWTRHDPSEAGQFRGEPMLWPDGCGSYIYKHPESVDDDCPYWYYPFPVPEINSTTQPFMPEQTEHIFCKTKQAKVRAYREEDSEKNGIKIYDGSDKVIGSMRLHNHDQLLRFPVRVAASEPEEVKLIDLVAICRSRIYSKKFDKDKQIYATINEPEDIYNVLWVEWIDGIAYRCAGGRVDKAEWESLELKEVDLILG